MNNITLTTPGKAGQIEIQATYAEMKEYYRFLKGVQHRLYSDGPEWLIDLFEVMEEHYWN